MRDRSKVALALVIAAAVLIAAASVAAAPLQQSGSRQGEVHVTGSLASKIHYQGRLTDAGGNPLNGSYNLGFQLWNQASGGTKLSEETKSGVSVQNGLFTVELIVGQEHFTGQGLWLAIAVNGQALSPRQEMLPVPYALSLKPGGSIEGEGGRALTLRSDGDDALHVQTDAADKSGVWGHSDDGCGITGSSANNKGVQGFGPTGVYGRSDVDGGQGVHGHGTAADTEGVLGTADGANGKGVAGFGFTGVYGGSSADDGEGVFGHGIGARTEGVLGTADGANGKGVAGLGFTGVYGGSNADDGEGVFGHGVGARTEGVLGTANGEHGRGVWGISSGTAGDAYGVSGHSTHADGVEGYTNAASKSGVYGHSASGIGVSGSSSAKDGIVGTTSASDKAGVRGDCTDSVGVRGRSSNNDGVVGYTASANKAGVFGNSLVGNGVAGYSDGANGVLAVSRSGDASDAGLRARNEGAGPAIYSEGDLYITGAYRGNLGPNGGGAFPRPAYDSGWRSIGAGDSIWLPHLIGGNPDNYVVDLQFQGSYFGRHQYRYGTDKWMYTELTFWIERTKGAFWHGLTHEGIMVSRESDDDQINQIRLRIWVYR